MKDILQVNVATDLNHTYECATNIIGREGEGNTTQLELTIPKELSECSVYLDFEKPNGETLRTPALEVANGVATYDVPQYILSESGEIRVQVVFQRESGQIWKSSIKTYFNQKSINAVDDIPEKEDFITEAQKLVDQLNKEIAELAEMLASDAEFVENVASHIQVASYVTTITGSKLRFFVGTQADYEALEDTENLFAIITDDTAKEDIEAEIESIKTDLAEYKVAQAEVDEVQNNNFINAHTDMLALQSSVAELQKHEFATAYSYEKADGTDSFSIPFANLADNTIYALDAVLSMPEDKEVRDVHFNGLFITHKISEITVDTAGNIISYCYRSFGGYELLIYQYTLEQVQAQIFGAYFCDADGNTVTYPAVIKLCKLGTI